MPDFEEKVHPRHTALLVVDMQNDYCHPDGALAGYGVNVSSAEDMLPKLSALIEAARAAGANVIFVRTTHNEWTESAARKAMPLFQGMSPCQAGSWGAEFFGVSPEPDELIVTKHRYSSFVNTSLELNLRSLGVRTLIVTGTATNVCVDCTARDAFQRDYFVVVPSDCTSTSDAQLQKDTLANLEFFYAEVTASDKIMEAWTTPQ